jgi:hypothetical protein
MGVIVIAIDLRTQSWTARSKTSLARLNWRILIGILQCDSVPFLLNLSALSLLLLFRAELRSRESGRTKTRSVGHRAVAIDTVLKHDQYQILAGSVYGVSELSDSIVRVDISSMTILKLVKPALSDFFRGVIALVSFLDVLPDVGKGFAGASRDSNDVQRLFGIGLLRALEK